MPFQPALRVHGSEVKYFHKYVGYNMRLDAVHATTLRVQLPHVAGWLESRQNAARRYDKLIGDIADLDGVLSVASVSPDDED